MLSQRGNILFLILLAVVLFAALSYAVTQSMRGGGKDSGSEKADLHAAQILNDIAMWRATIMRLKMMDDYKQVLFNTAAANANGTCYSGATATTPCKTIGLFNSANGVAPPPVINAFYTPTGQAGSLKWNWSSTRATVNGLDVGTSLPDDIVTIYDITESLCKAINLKLNGTTAIATHTNGTDAQGRAYNTYNGTSFSGFITNASFLQNSASFADACLVYNGTVYLAQFMLEEK